MHFRIRTNQCLKHRFEYTTQISFKPCLNRKLDEGLCLCLEMGICFNNVPLKVKELTLCHFLSDCSMTWWHLHLISQFVKLVEENHEVEVFNLKILLNCSILNLFIYQVILLTFILCLRFDLMKFRIKSSHFLILPKLEQIYWLELQCQKQESLSTNQ